MQALAKSNVNSVVSHYNNTKSVVCGVPKNKKKLKRGDNWLFIEEYLEFFYQHCVTQPRQIGREITFDQLTDEYVQIQVLNVTNHLQIKPV